MNDENAFSILNSLKYSASVVCTFMQPAKPPPPYELLEQQWQINPVRWWLSEKVMKTAHSLSFVLSMGNDLRIGADGWGCWTVDASVSQSTRTQPTRWEMSVALMHKTWLLYTIKSIGYSCATPKLTRSFPGYFVCLLHTYIKIIIWKHFSVIRKEYVPTSQTWGIILSCYVWK